VGRTRSVLEFGERVNKFSGFKANSNSFARKKLRIGVNEALILYFALMHTFVTAASVKAFYSEYGVELDLRRLHDSLKRLVMKGVLEKVSHGVYKLTGFGKAFAFANILKIRSIASSVLIRKEVECSMGFGVFANGGGFVFRRVRIHFNACGVDLETVVRKLVFVRKVVDYALSCLRGLLGVSRYRRIARSVRVVCVDCFVGGHGIAGLRTRCVNRSLISFDYFESLGVKPKEIGVDVYVATNVLDKLFAKIYIG